MDKYEKEEIRDIVKQLSDSDRNGVAAPLGELRSPRPCPTCAARSSRRLSSDAQHSISFQTFHVEKTQDWKQYQLVFNSLDHNEGRLYLGTWNGKSGKLWWDDLDLLYFGGYALWGYTSAPFIFTRPGFELEEVEPWTEDGERWPGLRVRFPEDVPAHSREQTYYFDDRWLIRRNDYTAALPAAEKAAQLAPKLFAAQNALGRALVGTGQLPRGIAALEEAARLAPDSAEMFFSLARAYQKAGRKEDAERARATFAELDQKRKAAQGAALTGESADAAPKPKPAEPR
jgi:tetratricopeptide (TPR) repeat protein